MPIFELQTPDGKNFEVDAPDMQSAAGALGSMKAPSSPQQIGTGEDVAKSAATGVEEGGIGLGGALGDIQSLADKGVGWAAQKLGYDPAVVQGTIKAAQQVGGRAPTSQQITDTAKAAGVPFHDPQTMAGEYARTAGQFLPASMLGPGSMGAKLASGAAGAVASEGAGQATKGTEAEPYARFAGGVLGGGLGYAAATRPGNIVKQIAKSAPTEADVYAAKQQAYHALDNAGVNYSQPGFTQFAGGLAQKYANKIDPDLHHDSSVILSRIIDKATSPNQNGLTFDEFDHLRQLAGQSERNYKLAEADRSFAGQLKDDLDHYADAAPLTTNGSVPPDAIPKMAADARELASRLIKTRMIDRAAETGRSGGYKSGEEAGYRQQMGAILKNTNKRESLSPVEQQAVKQAVHGSTTNKLLGSAGRGGIGEARGYLGPLLAGGAGASTLGAMLTPVLGPLGPVVGGALTIGGASAAGKLAAMGTERAVGRASQTALAGRSAQAAALAKRIPRAERLRALTVRALLAGDASQTQKPQE